MGKAEVEHWTDSEGQERTTKRILADDCGPDLRWATASVNRVTRRQPDASRNADEAGGDEEF